MKPCTYISFKMRLHTNSEPLGGGVISNVTQDVVMRQCKISGIKFYTLISLKSNYIQTNGLKMLRFSLNPIVPMIEILRILQRG